MRILILYRPRLPSLRAQAIQVTHTAHALAQRGHEVTLLADRGSDQRVPAGDALQGFGLDPVGSLRLRIAPTPYPPAAGLWFRNQVLRWWAGPCGVVLARDKRRLRPLLMLPRRHRLVLESHELDSALAQEAGRAAAPWQRLERTVIRRVDALVTNCAGTLALWRAHHAIPNQHRVVPNATSASRVRSGQSRQDVVRIVGSLRGYKGFDTIAEAAKAHPIEVVGASSEEGKRVEQTQMQLHPPVPYPQVPDLVAQSRVALLPLADNLFGRHLANPLKLWDYLATDVPLVLPDLPTIRESVDDACWYTPGQADSLVQAITRAWHQQRRPVQLRTWGQRAEELEDVLCV